MNARNEFGRTPLFKAVVSAWRDPAIAELLIDRGADVRARDRWGGTPLHVATTFEGEAILLRHGAEIDARDEAGRTPLHRVARAGQVEEATFLVSRGADVGIRDHRGRRPLDLVRGSALMEPSGGSERELFERLLGGFMTAKPVEATPSSLIMQVENLHSKYPEAVREASARKTFAVPCGLFRDEPRPGDFFRYPRGLSLDLEDAWHKVSREARRKELGIEPVR